MIQKMKMVPIKMQLIKTLNKRKEMKMAYFVKNQKIHKKPVPNNCQVKYTDQKVHNTIPAGYEKCDHCFNLPK